jgi:hypothetical protein
MFAVMDIAVPVNSALLIASFVVMVSLPIPVSSVILAQLMVPVQVPAVILVHYNLARSAPTALSIRAKPVPLVLQMLVSVAGTGIPLILASSAILVLWIMVSVRRLAVPLVSQILVLQQKHAPTA